MLEKFSIREKPIVKMNSSLRDYFISEIVDLSSSLVIIYRKYIITVYRCLELSIILNMRQTSTILSFK